VKWSEHGLGHLLNPEDPEVPNKEWIKQVWEDIVREALRRPRSPLPWLDRPAVSRLAVSSPALLRPFATVNAWKPYADQVKPFGFMLLAHVAAGGYPAGVDATRFQLVSPYEPDARQWRKRRWLELYSGRSYFISTGSVSAPDTVRVKTYRDVVAEYRFHPEAKSCGPDGTPCSRQTVGLLQRRPVVATRVAYIGKESNRLEEVEAGLVHTDDAVYNAYHERPDTTWEQDVLPALQSIPVSHLMQATGLARSTIKAIRNGHAAANRSTRTALTAVVLRRVTADASNKR
jgi:hypothetical protein